MNTVRVIALLIAVLAVAAPAAAQPKENAPATALWVGRSLGSLDRCRGGWCRIKVEDARGWVRQNAAWGLSAAPVCDGRR